jgi:diguanylate cyclase (GGDEF)-like protein
MAVVAASSYFGWEAQYPARAIDEIVRVLCLVFVAGCAAWAARGARGRGRQGWTALAVASVAWAAAEILWTLDEVRPGGSPLAHPSAADVVLIVFPIGACLALVCLSDRSRHSRRRLVLDGVIVATSLCALSWIFLFDDLARISGSTRKTTLVQVIADVVLLTTAILVWSRARSDSRQSLNLVVAGIISLGVSDMAIVYLTRAGGYHTGGFVDLVRVAALGMLALAALSSVNEPSRRRSPIQIGSRARMWLPYLPLLLAGGVGLAYALRYTQHGPLLAMVAVIVAAVLARQFVVLLENQGLLASVTREAFHDNLTGLANRALFLDRVERAVAARRRDAAPLAVLCLDLDNFKTVNDALGHAAGDELLIRVADRLRGSLREVDTVARLGGDEFAVLIEAAIEDSLATAHRVLDAFASTIVIEGVPLTVRPSIGLTVATGYGDCAVDDLLRDADLAMYAAKREGGGCVRSFIPDLPFPYELPQLTDSESLAVESPDTATPASDRTSPAPTALPNDHIRGCSIHFQGRPTSIWIAFAVLAIGVGVYAVSTVIRENGGPAAFFAEALYPVLNVTAAGLVALRAYRLPAERSAWVLIAAGMASSAMGDVIYAAWVPQGQSPSAADPAYLAYYPLVFAGLLLLIKSCLQRVPLSIRLDSLVCGLTVAAVAVALARGPIEAATTRATATVLVGLGYPSGDLLLVAVAAGIIPILGWRNEFRWSLLVVGFIISAAADTVYLFETSAGAYRVGTSLDACWPVASLMIAVASWLPASHANLRPKPGVSSYVTPVICTAVALGVAIVANERRIAVTLAALSLVAVAARFAVTFRDVSALAESHKQAMTDSLTGLGNRRALATALTAASDNEAAQAAESRSRRALLLVNLDEFQEINDFAGRHVGDQLLCRIASRLSQSLRPRDQLFRTGSDEFAVLLAEGADLVTARAQAGTLVDGLRAPFALDQITVQVDASVAIALYPDHCSHQLELLNRVEKTMPYATAAATRIAVYDSASELVEQDDFDLVEDLRNALSSDELMCYYQPKIAADDSIHSVEALLRWRHPRRGLLLPEVFLPAAERAGLMRQVANCVVNLALRQARSWHDHGINLTVAVNLSTTNLLDLGVVETIERLLRTYGLPASALIVEITESTLGTDSQRSRKTVAALRRLGVRISLDDYGTGWSSLARLQDLSVDELKLDRVFVARLAEDPRSIAIVRSTVALAQSLGADLVAEGVEDVATLRALRQYGCDITQGYVHSPPLPMDAFERWMADYQSQFTAVVRQPAAMTE